MRDPADKKPERQHDGDARPQVANVFAKDPQRWFHARLLGRPTAGFGQGHEDRAQRHSLELHVAAFRKHAAHFGGGALRVEPRFHEADHRPDGFRLQPVRRPLARQSRRGFEGENGLAEARAQRLQLLGELQFVAVQVADVAGETLDLAQVVRRDEDGGLAPEQPASRRWCRASSSARNSSSPPSRCAPAGLRSVRRAPARPDR